MLESTDRVSRVSLPAVKLASVEWKGERILFHPASGETHFVNSTGARVIDCFDNSSLSLEELLDRVSRSSVNVDRDALLLQLRELVERFEALGILNRVEHSDQVA